MPPGQSKAKQGIPRPTKSRSTLRTCSTSSAAAHKAGLLLQCKCVSGNSMLCRTARRVLPARSLYRYPCCVDPAVTCCTYPMFGFADPGAPEPDQCHSCRLAGVLLPDGCSCQPAAGVGPWHGHQRLLHLLSGRLPGYRHGEHPTTYPGAVPTLRSTPTSSRLSRQGLHRFTPYKGTELSSQYLQLPAVNPWRGWLWLHLPLQLHVFWCATHT